MEMVEDEIYRTAATAFTCLAMCASGREVTVVIALVIAFYSILYRIEFVLPSLHEHFVRLVDLPISPVAFPHD